MKNRTAILVGLAAAVALMVGMWLGAPSEAANETTMTSVPIVLTTSDTEATITLDPRYQYTFGHDGETSAGVANTATVYLRVGGAAGDVDNDESEGANKVKLISARAVALGPGISAVHFQTKAATTGPTMTVVPARLR